MCFTALQENNTILFDQDYSFMFANLTQTHLPSTMVYYSTCDQICCPKVDKFSAKETAIKLEQFFKEYNFENHLSFRFCNCVPILIQSLLYARIHYLMKDYKDLFKKCYLDSTFMIIFGSYGNKYLDNDIVNVSKCNKKCSQFYSRYLSDNMYKFGINFFIQMKNDNNTDEIINDVPKNCFSQIEQRLILVEHINNNNYSIYQQCDKCIIFDYENYINKKTKTVNKNNQIPKTVVPQINNDIVQKKQNDDIDKIIDEIGKYIDKVHDNLKSLKDVKKWENMKMKNTFYNFLMKCEYEDFKLSLKQQELIKELHKSINLEEKQSLDDVFKYLIQEYLYEENEMAKIMESIMDV